MGMHLSHSIAVFIAFVQSRLLVFRHLTLLQGLGFLRILLTFLFFRFVLILGSTSCCSLVSCSSCSSTRVIFIVFNLVADCELVVEGLGLTQRIILPLTIWKRLDDLFIVTCQVGAIRHMVCLVLTYVPVGLYEVIHGDNAEIISPKQRL